MERLITYKYRLYPSERQKILLSKHFDSTRWVYNYALGRKVEYYKTNEKSLTRYDLQKELVLLKRQEDTAWLSEVNSQSLQSELKSMDIAFTKFFREKSGFPKFKNKSDKNSFHIPQEITVDFQLKKVIIPKFRDGIKAKLHRKFEGDIRNATLCMTSGNRYFISVLVRENCPDIEHKTIDKNTAIGIDLGIKHYLVTSNGDEYDNPAYLRLTEGKIMKEQRRLSKMKKGGENWKKQKVVVSKLYEKITNQRADYLHKISRELVNGEFDTFCIEDLNIKGMLKNKKLAKSISDCSWKEFTTLLKYKSAWVGKNVLEIGRFEPSSKTCNVCGRINRDLKLSDREWVCECGAKHDRDINAAINIRDFAFDKQNLIGLGKPKSTPMEIEQ